MSNYVRDVRKYVQQIDWSSLTSDTTASYINIGIGVVGVTLMAISNEYVADVLHRMFGRFWPKAETPTKKLRRKRAKEIAKGDSSSDD